MAIRIFHSHSHEWQHSDLRTVLSQNYRVVKTMSSTNTYEPPAWLVLFSSIWDSALNHLTQHVHGSQILKAKALWLQHGLDDVAETSICHLRFTYNTNLLNLKLFVELLKKLLKLSMMWRFNIKFFQLLWGSSSMWKAEVQPVTWHLMGTSI